MIKKLVIPALLLVTSGCTDKLNLNALTVLTRVSFIILRLNRPVEKLETQVCLSQTIPIHQMETLIMYQQEDQAHSRS